MNHESISAARAVALACLGAESVRTARAGSSRRALGRATGIPGTIISDIEDSSVLPSSQQLAALSKHIEGIDATKFEDAQRLGQIPWIGAVEEILRSYGPSSAQDLARRIADAVPNCDPSVVSWRLSRELTRLESSGIFTRSTSGAWTATDGSPAASPLKPGRWSKHEITHRHDPEHDALFHLEPVPGSHQIVLNRSHPYYEPLRQLLDTSDLAALTADALRSRLETASQMMRGLLVAWAEYEDGEKSGARRESVRDARQAWGRAARRVAELDAPASRPLSI